ncbi:MAG: 2Fe-2S iron-sulfur cluster binding domain-containing protein [Neisseriaceae bacterium]|nr:2Fe-2S iron-sulfur cluster binding domain-containing protein [Neisseriaceae bacterium]
MSTITLTPSNVSFDTLPNEPLLMAAKRQNLNLPHSCQSGNCGACKATVVSGDFSMGEYKERALSAEEREQGKVLLCQVTAHADMVVDLPEYLGADAPQVKTFPVRVKSIAVHQDVAVVQLAMPANNQFTFWPGQYVDVLLKDNQSRSYSIATAPSQTDYIELHIRQQPDGLFSNVVFGGLQEKAIFRIKAPLGSFTLAKDSQKPKIFMATGTGFAPIKSMLQSLINAEATQQITVYWGVRTKQALYDLAAAEALISQLPHATLVPILSQPLAEDNWQGRRGYIQDAVLADTPDLSGHEVYACGSPSMIEASQTKLTTEGNLAQNAFYADAFTPSI